MARSKRIPKLTHHKATGQAVVRLAGKDHYCGRWATDSARARYHRLIAIFLTSCRTWGPHPAPVSILSLRNNACSGKSRWQS